MPNTVAENEAEHESEYRSSQHAHWWDALPGVFTALAALLTAINNLYHVLADADEANHSSDDEHDKEEQHGSAFLKEASITIRHGWGDASKKLADSKDDMLIISDFKNEGEKA